MTKPAFEPLEFLYFDLGKVLVDFDHEQAVRQLAELTGRSTDQVREVVFQSELQARYECGQLDTAEFCQRFRDATQTDDSDADICRAASDIFSLNQPVCSLVRRLNQSDIRIGILSNTCDAHWSHIVAKFPDLIQLFDPLILSYEVGAAKPDPKIYQAAIERAGVAPERIFFVDDLLANVQGALSSGLNAVHYVSCEQLQEDLAIRGVWD